MVVEHTVIIYVLLHVCCTVCFSSNILENKLNEVFSLSRKYPSRYFLHFGYAHFFVIMLLRFSDQHARISIIQNKIDMRHGQTRTKMPVYYRNIKRSTILNFPVVREVFQPGELYYCIIKIMRMTLRVIKVAPMNMKYKQYARR